MKIDVSQFTGIAPRINDALLPVDHGTIAKNVAAYSGGIKPMARSTLAAQLAEAAATIYLTRNSVWLGFDKESEVVEAPLRDDQFDRVYYSNEDGVFVTAPSVWSEGTGNLPRISYALGQPAPTVAPTLSKAGTPGGSPVTRYYAYSRVSVWGEESPPSPLASIDVETGETVTAADFVAASAEYVPTAKYYLYRSETGTTADSLVFVAETTATSFEDVVTVTGDAIDSILWDGPPTGLRGIIPLPNGAIAGFVGRELWFSEPYQPHAWPSDYMIPLDYDIVAIGVTGGTVVVATTAQPYIVHGAHPATYLPQKLPEYAPCLSGKGLVSSAGGVIWPSLEGLYAVSGGGAQYITFDKVRRIEWNSYFPATMIGAAMEGGYLGLYFNGNSLRAAVKLERDGTLTTHDIAGIAIITNQQDGFAYFLASNGTDVYKVGGNTSPSTMEWQSKSFKTPPWNPAAARVEYSWDFPTLTLPVGWLAITGFEDDAPLGCALLGGQAIACDSAMPIDAEESPEITFTIISDGVDVHTETVTSQDPFWLPGQYLTRETAFRVSANAHISRVVVANSMQEAE